MKRARMVIHILGALLLGLSVSLGFVKGAAAVEPVFVEDNPSCEDLGYDFGFKIEKSSGYAGTYWIDGLHYVTITSSDDKFFDWESNLGMDAVIAKGGPNANVYYYDPEAFGDTGLRAPDNEGGNIPTLSHIDFCFDYEVSVSKTAETSYTRTYEWDIDKTVTPHIWHIFFGDTATSQYTVSVEKTGYMDSDWAVEGEITIFNPAPIPATIESVEDWVNGIEADVICPVTFPYVLDPYETLICTYGTPLPDEASRTNVATVTTSGDVGGGEGTAPVTFGDPTTEINDTIHVSDTNGGSWIFTDTGSVNYETTYDCSAEVYLQRFHNVATIDETGQSDGTWAKVYCHELDPYKDATPWFTRTYHWDIDKWANHSELTLSTDQIFTVHYTIDIPEPTYTDSDFAVSGDITIYNPAPIPATLLGVVDWVNGTPAEVDCGVDFPYELPAGGTLVCSYYADGLTGLETTNVATVTQQNYAYHYEDPPVPIGATVHTPDADFEFVTPTEEIDECVTVDDTNHPDGLPAEVCVPDTPWHFEYDFDIGPYEVCGEYEYSNTASFVTNDTGSGAEDTDTWTIVIHVPCPGCTLTQGYWKTHSINGPAPYDDTWGGREGDTFFLSGQTWYQVFWTAPKGGDAYYTLAHQYIAAILNQANGASVPLLVSTTLADATDFFAVKYPGLKGKTGGMDRAQALLMSSILSAYNEGLIGPGHCSE
jgi:hypothetical protein